MDFIGIINSLGVLGTLILGFINLFLLKKSERQSREYNLKMIDYEKRRDFLLTNISEYISLLDAHKLSFLALSKEEYEGKDREIYSHYYKLETCFYKIKLYLNSDNLHFTEFLSVLDISLNTAEEIRFNNSFAEMISNGLRHPQEYADAYYKSLNCFKKSESDDITNNIELDKENIANFIQEANNTKNEHLEKYLSAVEKLLKYKKEIIDIARKYLQYEKNLILGGKNKELPNCLKAFT